MKKDFFITEDNEIIIRPRFYAGEARFAQDKSADYLIAEIETDDFYKEIYVEREMGGYIDSSDDVITQWDIFVYAYLFYQFTNEAKEQLKEFGFENIYIINQYEGQTVSFDYEIEIIENLINNLEDVFPLENFVDVEEDDIVEKMLSLSKVEELIDKADNDLDIEIRIPIITGNLEAILGLDLDKFYDFDDLDRMVKEKIFWSKPKELLEEALYGRTDKDKSYIERLRELKEMMIEDEAALY